MRVEYDAEAVEVAAEQALKELRRDGPYILASQQLTVDRIG